MFGLTNSSPRANFVCLGRRIHLQIPLFTRPTNPSPRANFYLGGRNLFSNPFYSCAQQFYPRAQTFIWADEFAHEGNFHFAASTNSSTRNWPCPPRQIYLRVQTFARRPYKFISESKLLVHRPTNMSPTSSFIRRQTNLLSNGNFCSAPNGLSSDPLIPPVNRFISER